MAKDDRGSVMVAVLLIPVLGVVLYGFFLTVLAVLEWVADASLRYAAAANTILMVTSALLAVGFVTVARSRRAGQLGSSEIPETG